MALNVHTAEETLEGVLSVSVSYGRGGGCNKRSANFTVKEFHSLKNTFICFLYVKYEARVRHLLPWLSIKNRKKQASKHNSITSTFNAASLISEVFWVDYVADYFLTWPVTSWLLNKQVSP